MFCPSCGTEANDQTKYCTKCGFDLRQIKDALVRGEPDRETTERAQNRFEFQKELAAHAVGMRYEKKTPEEKRILEIKGGVITSSVGFGLMIFLGLLFDGIAQTINGPEKEIILALRFVGIIPFLVGIGLIINGLFVSKRLVEAKRRQELEEVERQPLFSYVPETSSVQRISDDPQSLGPDFSITETTTTKLREPVQVSAPHDE